MTAQTFSHQKYAAFPAVPIENRTWPDQVIDVAPEWCAVDLRDGNQALVEPMNGLQKRQFFDVLVRMGFKQIEVGFPSASQPDYEFVRQLIDENLIPDDVKIQVLTQARDELIERSFEALAGAKNVIMHMYNSTSTVQREQVFRSDREGVKAIAVHGAETIKKCAAKYPDTNWTFEYSPESFTGTELDYAVEVCNAVNAVWEPTPEHPVINNLPATVEMAGPHVYADQIELFLRKIDNPDSVIVSLHTHNDRGCAVAAAELGVMAGARRVEGTLFGNGERTGNMDIITMAMNLYSQGVDPELDMANMDEIMKCATDCTQLPIHPRHPYVGELVYSAFSGSHQDAIKKCLAQRDEAEPWDVAYLPIDPHDLGRSYQEVIRINSQSGKGGVAYVLENEYGLNLPRWMQIDFSGVVQKAAEETESEVSAEMIWSLFSGAYLEATEPYSLVSYQTSREDREDSLQAVLKHGDQSLTVHGAGSGVIESFLNALQERLGQSITVVEYSEHATTRDTQAQAATYMQLSIDGTRYCGAAMSVDIVTASLKAILSAINRSRS